MLKRIGRRATAVNTTANYLHNIVTIAFEISTHGLHDLMKAHFRGETRIIGTDIDPGVLRMDFNDFRKWWWTVKDSVIAKVIVGEPIKLTRLDKNTEHEYVLYRGVVWQDDRELQPEQWRLLVDTYLLREEAKLAQELGISGLQQGRERITSEVRRAVWTRDRGCCVQCDSRDRLEYDHIIPLSKGGSNTERNLELLCEKCNRAKSDQIS